MRYSVGMTAVLLKAVLLKAVLLKDAKDCLEELLVVFNIVLPNIVASNKGEEVVIAKEDGGTFKVVSTETPAKNKRCLVGSAKGKVWMADNVNEPLEDFNDHI